MRRARSGETLKTLDGVERKLTPEDLVIADAKKPVALAGVMGGFDTMITEKTRNILIESAWLDPATVRKMSRRHGLHTDASHRFERGADFEHHAAGLRPRGRADSRIGRRQTGRRAHRRGRPARSIRRRSRCMFRRCTASSARDQLARSNEFSAFSGALGFGLMPEQRGGQARVISGVNDSQLASGRGTRDRSDRRDRAPARLRQIPEHAARVCRRGGRTARRGRRDAQVRQSLLALATTKPCR